MLSEMIKHADDHSLDKIIPEFLTVYARLCVQVFFLLLLLPLKKKRAHWYLKLLLLMFFVNLELSRYDRVFDCALKEAQS